MGEERFNRFLGAFDEEAPTSIRLNPRFARSVACGVMSENTTVPWCPEGITSKVAHNSPSIPSSMPAATMSKKHPLCSLPTSSMHNAHCTMHNAQCIMLNYMVVFAGLERSLSGMSDAAGRSHLLRTQRMLNSNFTAFVYR